MAICPYKEGYVLGEIISIGDGLIITVFSMIVVFLILLGIAYIIDILKVFINDKKDDKERDGASIVAEERPADQEGNSVEINDEELLAVIAAAIAASLGKSIPQIKIKTIKRLPNTSPIWAETGRREQIFNKL